MTRDAAHCRVVLHRPGTLRTSPLFKETAENAVEASWIIGAAIKVAELS